MCIVHCSLTSLTLVMIYPSRFHGSVAYLCHPQPAPTNLNCQDRITTGVAFPSSASHARGRTQFIGVWRHETIVKRGGGREGGRERSPGQLVATSVTHSRHAVMGGLLKDEVGFGARPPPVSLLSLRPSLRSLCARVTRTRAPDNCARNVRPVPPSLALLSTPSLHPPLSVPSLVTMTV